jgi:thiosulfate reductase cytochrome b subunit
MQAAERSGETIKGALVFRQSIWTRVTHWIWALALFFLLLSGLQIFNAHPTLYLGDQSGTSFDNSVLAISAKQGADGLIGYVQLLGRQFQTTGFLGYSGAAGQEEVRAFPGWATIPSFRDLGTGRVVHFFFAWVLSFTLLAWLAASLINGHLLRDLLPRSRDWRALPRDVANHLRLRFDHAREYNTLQKLSYAGVLFILLPLMIATGLAMSPAMNAAWPWLPELFGGRQTARTVHFVGMALLVLFFIVHIVMVIAAGPINEMRSMITGWYRTSKGNDTGKRA